jgi:hypothetical protein
MVSIIISRNHREPILRMCSCAIEMSMVASHVIWLLRTRGIRRRAKEAGETFDESEEGAQWQAKGLDMEKKIMCFFSKKSTLEEEDRRPVRDDADTLVNPDGMTSKTVPNAVA